MRIYTMTATFGKLENKTLTLQPGLNIIEAPNEWGKSTWCAFLMAMLYGIDTRERTTSDHLADKERYAPWSGAPMSGRIDLRWRGRDITIERSTKGRIPLGNFRAYETASGLPIPALTATNCGEVLLGMERSVFQRTGFLKLTDMPVGQDAVLSARLTALVTTGDESGTAQKLGAKLRELKNRCRYNRSGLLPQAEAQRAALCQKLADIEDTLIRYRQLQNQQTKLETYAAQLDNHRQALDYSASLEAEQKLAAAHTAKEAARVRLEELERQCRDLPPRDIIKQDIHALQQLQAELSSATSQLQLFPQIQNSASGQQAEADSRRYKKLRSPLFLILAILGLLTAAAGAALYYLSYEVGIYLLAGGGISTVVFLIIHLLRRSKAKKLLLRYGSAPALWAINAAEYIAQQTRRQELEQSIRELNTQIHILTGGQETTKVLLQWQEALHTWTRLDLAQQELRQAESYEQALAATRPAAKPAHPDTMTLSLPETLQAQSDTVRQLRQLQLKLGQSQGRLEQLGSREDTQRKLDQLNQRITKLEETYQALTLALQSLDHAQAELQRRFAPQITANARDIIARLTGNRYDKLRLDQGLNLLSGAQSEVTLHSPLWRSDGTADQLYLALRLAVAKALTPAAPLVLDDALVRFDDTRLKAALDILKEEAQHKQILLFTCQSREKNML